MLNDFLISTGIAWAFAIVMMLVVWWISVRIHNWGLIDIAWSAGFVPIVIFYAAYNHGWAPRRWLIAGMVTLWSARLGAHVYFRVMGQHPKEDVRYVQLRKDWSRNLNTKMFWFFQLQAALLPFLAVPFLISCLNDQPGIRVIEWVGSGLWLVALIGETVADSQLKHFRAYPKNHGEVCEVGLWRYSRHPNYFFEWLMWMAFFLFALGSPLGCATIYCPALMLYFLLRVTGIPMTEAQSVKSKGEKYIRYQKTTSAFLPWFRKDAR